MTAINPARLKMQIIDQGDLIDQSDRFVARLHELFAFYSARIKQTSLSRTPLRLQTYQVPRPVIQALENELIERLDDHPEVGYSLVDALWEELWVEFRQLAITVAGILPTDEPSQILDRLQDWLKKCSSEDIRRSIMTEGLRRLANDRPDQCFILIENLINSNEKGNHQAALFGLGMFARNSSYLNLPVLFRNLSKILKIEEKGLTKEICDLLRILIERSEQETTFFLIKQLDSAHQPRIQRVIRQVLNDLSPENQRTMREKIGTKKNR
jgi:hypothetical protein